MRGGLWEVDLLLRLMSPCYWPEARQHADYSACHDQSGPFLLHSVAARLPGTAYSTTIVLCTQR